MGPLLVFQAEVAGMLTDDSGNRELEEMHKQASSAIASRQVLFFLASHVCVCLCMSVCVCPSACVRLRARGACVS